MKPNQLSNFFIVLALLLSTLSAPAAVAAAPASPASAAPPNQGNVSAKIDPLILEELTETGKADFFVVFKDTADLSPAYSMNWHDRGYFVVDTLKAMAERSQINVRKWLTEQNIRYTVFWINNSLFVHADRATIEALMAFPEIAEFRGNHVSHIFDDEPVAAPRTEGQIMAPAYPWNITFPMADQVHAQYGIKGQGVVIGGMDTGAEYTHMGLVQNYRGCTNPPACTIFDHTYSWYDPSSSCGGAPCDTDTHGTATMGIMAGDDDPALPSGAWIGMAPDAQWIHCVGCPYGSCPDYDTTACAQWFLAPGGNPNLRPQVVNHSWGLWSPNDCNGNSFQTQLMAYRAADIVPAFAAGNVGDACNSSTSPANNTDSAGNPIAFASGAHGPDGSLDSYSSCGWNACNPTKLFPDVASPGQGSCTTGTGNSYNCAFGGTSSASPHTAGCVALVRSANPTLSVADVEQVIRDAANDVDDTSCGGDIDWNNRYGEGHLDCYEAVQLAGVGGMGTLNGTVTDATTTLPLEDATLHATLTPTRTWQTTTDDLGYYEMRVMTGTLSLEAWKYGYVPEVRSTTVFSGVTTTENFALFPAVMYTVDGIVTDATTGWPLYARIDIDGYPYNPVWTDPETGYYSVSLAEGVAYTFHVNAWVPGYVPAEATVGPLSGNLTVDFGLQADMVACIAPGYEMSLTLYFSDDFESGYSNWTMDGLWNTENQADTCGSYIAPFPSPANAAYYGIDGTCTYNNGATNSGSLTMAAPVALPGTGAAFLSFASYEQTECGGECSYDNRYVEVSTDGGTSWSSLGEAANEGAWYTASFDLSGYAGSNVQVRFRFDTVDSAVNDYFGWMVDDVAIQTGTCTPLEGGLVVGNVYDDNTDLPLNGATVTADTGAATGTLATPEDPAVDDGFYTLFVEDSSVVHDLTATMPSYSPDTETVLVPAWGTVAQDFYLGTGQLVADPTSIAVTMDMGVTHTEPLTLTNIGSGEAGFAISEIDLGFLPALARLPVYVAPTVVAPPMSVESYAAGVTPARAGLDGSQVPLAPARYTDASSALVYYGDRATFDADYPGLPVEGFENTLVPDFSVVACDGPFDSATNNACFTPGGILDGIRLMNTTAGNQMVVLGDGFLGNPDALVGPNTFTDNHDLTFYNEDVYAVGLDIWSPNGAATFDIYLYGPGDLLLGQTSVLAASTGTFWGVSSAIPIVRIRTESAAGAGELFDNVAFGGGGDVPWLSESPVSGTVPVGGDLVVDVIFDSTGVGQPGDYEAILSINTDTPYGALQVPVTMTVQPPPSYGKLEGTITGLGYCDGESYPLADAVVLIEGSSGMTWTTTTDGAGYYVWWLDSVDSPYIVSVTAEGHLGAQVTGVVINPGGATTTVDFALRWLQPCLSVTPDSLAATLDMGATETQQITLTNSGAAPAMFNLQEMDRGYAPNAEGGVPTYTPPAASAEKPGSLLDRGEANARGTAAPVTMQGEVLLDQAPNQVNGLFSDSDCANCPTGQQSIAENFYLAEGGAIGQIVFWTGYWPADTPIDPDQITVIFHEDAAGYPGAVIYSEAPVAYERVQTGVILFGVHEWVHTLTLGSPVVLDPGAYWVEIYNNTAGNSDQFFWETGNLDPAAGLAGSAFAFETPGQTWNYDSATDLAIQLIEGGGDVPWLSEAPISGTVPADGGQVVVDVTFDAGAVALPGEYWATLNVRSDDPVNGAIGLPVTMTVIAPPDWGILEGTVTGMGHCDAESYPLEGATVVAADGGVMTVTTDVDGEYAVWLEEGTYEVVASADGHTEGTAQVTITGQQTTTQDFDLRSLQPCMSLTPPAMEATLLSGTSETQILTLINAGAAPSDFVIRETTRTVEILGLGTVTVAPGAGADLSSTAAPDGYVPALTPSSSPGAHLLGGTVAIFKDADPWGSLSTEAILAANGIPYEVHGSGEFGTLDFSAYGMIVINSDQPQAFYNNYASYVAKFEDYVEGGGFLAFFSADAGWNGGYLSAPLPGGMVWTAWPESANTIDDPAHPVVQGVPSPFTGDSASHGYFGNLPADAHVIVHGNESGQPNLVEYPLGDGWLIGFGQTAEISYDWGWEGGPILPNALLYGYAFEPAADVPWVVEDPITGTVPADDLFDVDVTFTALPTMPLGTYTATLIINTDDAQEPQMTVPLTLNIVSCVNVTAVDLTIVTTGTIFPGDTVNLEADVEPDNASKPYSYTVDYGDGTAPVTGSSSDDPLALTHTFAAAGSYTVTVSVWNCDMTEPVVDTAVVTVEVPCAPVTGLDFTWLPAEPVAGETVDLTALVTGGDEPITYTWSFGDGGTGEGLNVSHAFALAGDYTVWLTATNCGGEGVAVISHTLTIAVVPPPVYYYYLPITVKGYID